MKRKFLLKRFFAEKAALKVFSKFCVYAFLFSGFIQIGAAQTTVFTYQGKLTDGGAAANGTYDFTFKLFPSASGGTQIGADAVIDDAPVASGIFTVNLDFGSPPFASATANYLEIWVRAGASSGEYTQLSPRQPITSSPYAVQTIRATTADTATNALNLGGVAANQFVQTGDSRLSDARNPLAGSANYIQNSTVQQGTSNFFISGSGRANIFDAATQFNIGGNRVLGLSFFNINTFAGVGAGEENPTQAGNSFFGYQAGFKTTSAANNSFFGSFSGTKNTTGFNNSFFGGFAGERNLTGVENSFFGISAGGLNTTGSYNSFFGRSSGISNTTENFNTFIGAFTDGAAGITNATALGTFAKVTQSNSLVLGSINGINGSNVNTNIGIGTTAPNFRLHLKVDGQDGIKLQHTGTGLYPQVRWNDAADAFKASIGYGAGAGEGMRFFVNGNDRLIIQNDGLVRSNGGIFINNPNTLVITSPNGACWGVTVNNAGALATFSVACP